MSESQIEELVRRAAILIVKEHPCVGTLGSPTDFISISLGPRTHISIMHSSNRMLVTCGGDVYYRSDEIVTIYDEQKVEQVLQILRTLTVLDELSDV